MEGASWIARKAHVETERHTLKMQGVMSEFSKRFKDQCILDESIAELNGREVIRLNGWIADQIDKEMHDVGDRYESMFENVNYHLAEANRHFAT